MHMKAHLFYRIQAATPRGGLGRIRSIVERAMSGEDTSKIKSFALLSPNRANWAETLDHPDDSQEFQNKTQRQKAQDLKADLMGMQCGWGDDKHPCGYREGQGLGQEDGANVSEQSFFVANISLMNARRLWKRYYQWGIIYFGPETRGRVLLMGTDLKRGSRYIQDLGAMWTFTHPHNRQDLRNMEEAHLWDPSDPNSPPVNKSRFKGQEFVFASYPALCRPRR